MASVLEDTAWLNIMPTANPIIHIAGATLEVIYESPEPVSIQLKPGKDGKPRSVKVMLATVRDVHDDK